MVIEVTGSLVVQDLARKWCLLPYPGHPKGCPNYGVKDICPPNVRMVHDAFDLTFPHWFVIYKFDLAAHALEMGRRHPEWSDRQCRCCLYWQGTVRHNLMEEASAFAATVERSGITLCPEAMGVNVFRTCHRHRVMIRKNPRDIVYKVALVGRKRTSAVNDARLDSVQVSLPL